MTGSGKTGSGVTSSGQDKKRGKQVCVVPGCDHVDFHGWNSLKQHMAQAHKNADPSQFLKDRLFAFRGVVCEGCNKLCKMIKSGRPTGHDCAGKRGDSDDTGNSAAGSGTQGRSGGSSAAAAAGGHVAAAVGMVTAELPQVHQPFTQFHSQREWVRYMNHMLEQAQNTFASNDSSVGEKEEWIRKVLETPRIVPEWAKEGRVVRQYEPGMQNAPPKQAEVPAVTPEERSMRMLKFLERKLNKGDFSRVKRTMQSKGVAPVTQEIMEQLRAKHPQQDAADAGAGEHEEEQDGHELAQDLGDAVHTTITTDDVPEYCKDRKGRARCPFGSCADDISILFVNISEKAKRGFVDILNYLAEGAVEDAELLTSLRQSRGYAIIKKGGATVEVRPAASTCFLMQLASGISCRKNRKPLMDYIGLGNYAYGAGGNETLYTVLDQLRSKHPDWIFIKLDISNAYNTIHRDTILKAGKGFKPMAGLIETQYGGAGTVTYRAQNDEYYSLQVTRGGTQGDPKMTYSFAKAMQTIVGKLREKHPDTIIVGSHDDQYICAPTDRAVAVTQDYVKRMKEAGMEVQDTKSRAYVPSMDEQVRAQALMALATVNIPLADGLEVAGCYLGSREFEEAGLMQVVGCVQAWADTLLGLAKEPDVSRQALSQLARVGLPSMMTHTLRTMLPEVTLAAARKADRIVTDCALRLLDMGGIDDASAELVARIRLPVQNGGWGMTSCERIRNEAFLGSTALTALEASKFFPDCFTGSNKESPRVKAIMVALQDVKSRIVDNPAHADQNATNKTLRTLTVESLLEETRPKLQAMLTVATAHHAYLAVFESFPETQEGRRRRAAFISAAGRKAGLWTMASRKQQRNRFTNYGWSIAARLRLGAPLPIELGQGGKCPKCKTHLHPGNDLIEHVHSCSSHGRRTRNGTHTAVKDAVGILCRESGYLVMTEQTVVSLLPDLLTEDSAQYRKHRFDLGVRNGDIAFGIDVTVGNPSSASADAIAGVVKKPSGLANKRHRDKKDSYEGRFTNIGNRILPYSMEVNGAFSDETIKFMDRLAKDRYEAQTVKSRPYGYPLSTITHYIYERVSVALQQQNAYFIQELAAEARAAQTAAHMAGGSGGVEG